MFQRDRVAQNSAARELLEDVLEVLRNTGPRVGAVRSVQAARAGVLTALDLMGDRELLEALGSNRPPQDKLVARLLRRLFERLGATYVKLGQFIASSPTLFPEAYVREFQACLDRTEETPFARIERIVERDLGRPISSVFRSFERVPLASASIAQVHAAVLKTGEEVVVKVQKPGVRDTMKADLGFLYIAARVLEFLSPELPRSGELVAEIRRSMLDELDFRKEFKNLEVFREFLEVNGLTGTATAPKPYAEASSERVLTMQRLRGVPLIDLEGVRKYSNNPERTLISALNVWALSLRGCELFHADVHAGNLLVLEDGRVGFIDFGIVGRVPPKTWAAIERVVEGLAREDSQAIADGLIAMGATDAAVDAGRLSSDVASVLERVRGLQTEVVIRGREDGRVSAELGLDETKVTELLLEAVRVAENNGLKLPREFALLVKQALYFDRYTKLLAPELDVLRDERVDLGVSNRGGSPAAGAVIDV